jgi:hypothetical protein
LLRNREPILLKKNVGIYRVLTGYQMTEAGREAAVTKLDER